MISATNRIGRVYLTLLFVALISLPTGICTAATIVVNETFEGYTSFPSFKPALDPVNFGVPLTSEGADSNLWMAVRFEAGGDPNGSASINADVGVQQYGGPGSGNNTHVGRVGDTAGLVLRLDLTGFASATLDFDWRTYLSDPDDDFVVAYYKGDGTSFQPGGLGTPNNKYDWFNDPQLGNGGIGTWYTDNWVELLRSGPNDTFTHETFPLPGNDIVYLAFWNDDNIDGGVPKVNDDFGKFDNVVIKATVPEPASLGLLGLGLALAAAAVRRRER